MRGECRRCLMPKSRVSLRSTRATCCLFVLTGDLPGRSKNRKLDVVEHLDSVIQVPSYHCFDPPITPSGPTTNNDDGWLRVKTPKPPSRRSEGKLRKSPTNAFSED